jgi:hypothetical protein
VVIEEMKSGVERFVEYHSDRKIRSGGKKVRRDADAVSHVPANVFFDMSPSTKLTSLVFSAHGVPRRQQAPASTGVFPDTKSQDLSFADEVCMILFDGWCERRNVTALAYLMHAWPLIDDDLLLRRRLLQSLRELEKYHQDALLENELVLIGLLWNSLAAWE